MVNVGKGLKIVWCNKYVIENMNAVKEVYERMLTPTLLYGSAAWGCYEYVKVRAV